MKRIIRFCITLALALFVAAPAFAAQTTPTETIQHTVGEVLAIIEKQEMHDPAKREALLAEIESKIKTIFDFTEFSARTVGPKWRQFTPEQKNRFEEAFASLLRATYIEKLDGYDGEKVKFTGEVLNAKGDKAEVQSAVLAKDKEIPVAYRLMTKDGVWRVYDVRIEQISLVENYRGQFKDILLRGDAEELIKKVEEKSVEAKKENAVSKHQ